MAIYMWREPVPVSTAGIYHDTVNGVISLSSDGTNWLTIADKNLGATQVYNDGDTLSEANAGKYYQWGNNYGFPFTGAVTTSSSQVDTSTYGPGNYYSSSTFITTTNNWSLNNNKNLWGGVTDTNDSKRGPCAEGYHIPSSSEWWNLLGSGQLLATLGLNVNKGTDTKTYLKMPYAGYRRENSGSTGGQGSIGYYQASDCENTAYYSNNINFNSSSMNASTQYYKTLGQSIRPFKNTPVQPDDSWTVLYQPS